MKYILLLLISTYLFSQPLNSSITTYYENKNFNASVQKDDSVVYGVGAAINYENSQYKLTYEYGDTNTKQPPLSEDLKTEKLFLKYGYTFNDTFKANINYINIINDNIAITDNGRAYGAGLTYNIGKKVSLNCTQFYTDYEDFDVYQSDFKIAFKTNLDSVKLKLSSITKKIKIDEKNVNSFTKNAEDDYLTTGLKVNASYKTYHFGGGVYFGKRAFAIMDDGFKIQHHAMEFDRTYSVGVGKTISDIVLRMQYVYQRATELPASNEDVEAKVIRLLASYKF
ncbi:MAG: hypothetical protein ACI9RG_000664 [Sulfurimonas sp.]|jgi:hypothetical protein